MSRPIRTYVIGRSPFADVVVADPSVAPHHAEIVVARDGRLHLTCCSASGGTFRMGGGDEGGDGAAAWLPVRQAFIGADTPLRLGDFVTSAAALLATAVDRPDPATGGSGNGADGGGNPASRLRGRVERDAATGEIIRRRS